MRRTGRPGTVGSKGGLGQPNGPDSPESAVRLGISALVPIYLHVDKTSRIQETQVQIEFSAAPIAAKTSVVPSNSDKPRQSVRRHKITCNAASVLRAWHALGTQTLEDAVVLSATRLDEAFPFSLGPVWRVFGVRVSHYYTKIWSANAVLVEGFPIVDRSRDNLLKVARHYYKDVGINAWSNAIFWPARPLLSVSNAWISRRDGVVRLDGIGTFRAGSAVEVRHLSGSCRVAKASDGIWIVLQEEEDPDSARERYSRREMPGEWEVSPPFEASEDELEAISGIDVCASQEKD